MLVNERRRTLFVLVGMKEGGESFLGNCLRERQEN